MALLAACGPDHPPTSQAERDRIRELSKYYCTFRHSNGNEPSPNRAAPVDDEQPGAAYLSPDLTLNALAQLGVYRFGCNRSFISIIDDQDQHIIAETTASISLRHKDQHLSNDGIYLGFRTLNLTWGVCPQTMKLFTGQDATLELNTPNITANRTRYIIRNFADEACFRDRPYVIDWPHMRFYAEVPLFSASGHVLGSYCVVDDKPRNAFGDHEVALLQEIADAVSQHLENARIVHFHRQAEKLVKGVTDFVTEHPDPDAKLGESTATSSDYFAHPKSADDGEGGVTPSTQPGGDLELTSTAGDSSLSPSCTERSDLTNSTSFTSSLGGQLAAMTPLHENPSALDGDAGFRTSQTNSSVNVSRRIASIFSRASVILRDSMDLAGVLFVDAYQSNSGIVSSEGSPLPRNGRSSEESENLCESFGCAFRNSSPRGSNNDSGVTVAEKLLNKMIVAYPRGQIFNMSDRIEKNESAELDTLQDVTRQLATQFPDADSVLFIPLWDWNKLRWLAGTLVWTAKPQRALGMEELGFFKAFGNSIISEVARVNWDATEKSKSDFISSISHELRSPLHGVLGSTELLQTTSLDPDQANTVKTIERCGLSLLDVLDHLLDFTKVNNLKGGGIEANTTKLITDVDLGVLIEDVVEIMYTSRTTRNWKDFQSDVGLFLGTASQSASARDMNEPNVVVRIEEKNSWKVRSVSGAWKRIVMSLVGNSMKWTQQGVIEVSLSNFSTGSDSEPVVAHLSVTDTGSGISPDYLRHSVFTPFYQDDPLSEGAGLGLSLVHKLVAFLGGHIDMKSDLGVGTQVDVYIPVRPLNADCSGLSGPCDKQVDSIPPTRVCLIGFEGFPDLKETPTGILSTDAKRKLSIQKAISNVFMAQPNCSLSFAESAEKCHGDFAVIEEAKLQQLIQDESLASVQSRFKSFIVLGTETSVVRDKFKANFLRVFQPYGPRKIKDALMTCLNSPGLSGNHSDASTEPSPECVQESLPPKGPNIREDARNFGASTSTKHALAPPLPAPPQPPTNQDGLHVLIVDDNSINLKILTTFLRKLGCSYESATDGLMALEKYKESSQRFEYVLMDLSMPVMDGIVSTSNIRAFEKKRSMTAACIIAVTGVASTEMQQQAQLAGIDDYLIKPVSLQVLKKVLGIT